MSKRDAIIISVLVNAGLLAILFVTAVRSDPELLLEKENSLVMEQPQEVKVEMVAQAPTPQTFDEMDAVLQDFLPEPTKAEIIAQERPVTDSTQFVEVRVKKGDALEKIARSHGTTVDAIKKATRLTSDKLKIGQVLRIPKEVENRAPVVEKEIAAADTQFYTVKNGDNPWKIAKQFHVNFDDLLRMNNLDEEKARNLKAGDKLRVK